MISGVLNWALESWRDFRENGLELRTEFGLGLWDELIEQLPQGSFLVGLSSIHRREAWEYDERAFRYCQHDI